jgi:hypothetical protein
LRDQYRKYLKKRITNSGQSASIKILKWKNVDEMSFVRPYLLERDTVTNLYFGVKGETNEEELLQAENEYDGTAEQEEQTPASAKNKFRNQIFRGTRPRYQPGTASAVLMKYLVESDKERQAEPPVDPIEAFFKSIAGTVKMFSHYHQNIFKSRIFEIVSEVEMTEVLQVHEVEMTEILQETKSTHSSECSSGSPDEHGIQRKRVCDTNSAPVRAPKSVQLNSSNKDTYYHLLLS